MGGRSSTGSRGTSIGNRIRNELLNKGLNSKFPGVRRKAQEGTDNYSYKNAKEVSSKEALKMTSIRTEEYNGDVLAWGLVNNEEVFYANKLSDTTIQKLLEKKNKLKTQRKEEVEESLKNRPEISTTTTYDRWKKQHDKNFEAWFGKR